MRKTPAPKAAFWAAAPKASQSPALFDETEIQDVPLLRRYNGQNFNYLRIVAVRKVLDVILIAMTLELCFYLFKLVGARWFPG